MICGCMMDNLKLPCLYKARAGKISTFGGPND